MKGQSLKRAQIQTLAMDCNIQGSGSEVGSASWVQAYEMPLSA